ncbi:Concanavalin A-like lectin/glucanases superfamily protein [uncultured archaeon]|nr:Concanavalin A-like lectin/glucanases superfamily protein [uncultured archaeon]
MLAVKINDGSGELSDAGKINIADGRWHHIVFVRDRAGREVRGYVDGVLDVRFSDSKGDVSDTSRRLVIGNSNPLQDGSFVGRIFGVKTYSRALSIVDVQGLYASNLDAVNSIPEPVGPAEVGA